MRPVVDHTGPNETIWDPMYDPAKGSPPSSAASSSLLHGRRPGLSFQLPGLPTGDLKMKDTDIVVLEKRIDGNSHASV